VNVLNNVKLLDILSKLIANAIYPKNLFKRAFVLVEDRAPLVRESLWHPCCYRVLDIGLEDALGGLDIICQFRTPRLCLTGR